MDLVYIYIYQDPQNRRIRGADARFIEIWEDSSPAPRILLLPLGFLHCPQDSCTEQKPCSQSNNFDLDEIIACERENHIVREWKKRNNVTLQELFPVQNSFCTENNSFRLQIVRLHIRPMWRWLVVCLLSELFPRHGSCDSTASFLVCCRPVSPQRH